MKATYILSDGRLLCAEVCDDCGDLGTRLLARLATSAVGTGERDTIIVELDWATLQLCASAGQVRVEEPDYRKNPATFVDGLVRTSRVFYAQEAVLRAVGAASDPVSPKQYLRVSSDALAE